MRRHDGSAVGTDTVHYRSSGGTSGAGHGKINPAVHQSVSRRRWRTLADPIIDNERDLEALFNPRASASLGATGSFIDHDTYTMTSTSNVNANRPRGYRVAVYKYRLRGNTMMIRRVLCSRNRTSSLQGHSWTTIRRHQPSTSCVNAVNNYELVWVISLNSGGRRHDFTWTLGKVVISIWYIVSDFLLQRL